MKKKEAMELSRQSTTQERKRKDSMRKKQKYVVLKDEAKTKQQTKLDINEIRILKNSYRIKGPRCRYRC